MNPPKDVNFEVVVTQESGKRSIFDKDAFPSISNLDRYRPPLDKNVEVARRLQRRGITVHHIGPFSISASCKATKFEKFFSTKLSAKRPPPRSKWPKGYLMYAPKKGENWKIPTRDSLDTMIEKAYIQHPPILFSNERPVPPHWTDKFRLRVPNDVAQIMGASSVHRKGITGKNVKVVMPDTGFYHHPYFKEQGYNFLAVTAPDALDHTVDTSGHGTGECANLFSTAPGINFIGLKMNNPTLAIKTATELRPDIVTCSWGYDMDRPTIPTMPNWLKPLWMAVLDAVARGVIMVFASGNGHYGFPGSMPEVISVGGVHVDKNLNYSATRYTSGFMSTWFPGRQTPDFCGLCGTPPSADYIILPVQSGANSEKASGWGAFSGTSAAAPMVAGICALLKSSKPDLHPEDVKSLLKHTAMDITKGFNAHNKPAKPGPDKATGFGLTNAERAIDAIF